MTAVAVARHAARGRLRRAGGLIGTLWGALAVTLALGLTRLHFPIGTDAAVFLNAARLTLDGGLLYRDMWSHAFPLNSTLYAAIGSVLGITTALPHIIHLLESLAGVALVYNTGCRILGRTTGLAGAYIFGLSSMVFVRFDEVAEPEFLAGIAGLLTTMLLLIFLDRIQNPAGDRALLPIAAAGLATGVALAAKPVSLSLAAVAIFWLWKRAGTSRLRSLLAYTMGAAVVPLVSLLWLAAGGALSDAAEQLVSFNVYYGQNQVSIGVSLILAVAQGLQLGLPVPVATVGALLLRRRQDPRISWLLLWAGAGMIAVFPQGKHFSYHWLFALPALSLLAAHLLANAKGLIAARPVPRLMIASALLLVVAVSSGRMALDNLSKELSSLSSMVGRDSHEELLEQFPYMGGTLREDNDVASYLGRRTTASDTVFSWARPGLYVMADRKPAGKHAYILPLVYGPEELKERARAELMSDLRRAMPAYVVTLATPGWSWQMSPGVAFSIDPFPELQNFVDDNYVREAVLGNTGIYRRR